MANRRKKRVLSPADWDNLPDEQILELRVRDLGLQIPGSALAPHIETLRAELDARGIGFCPPSYLADEWFCPDKEPVIGVPFCLAHKRLKQIEQKIMLEVEGGSEAECMKILRHECGHAMNYAYRFFSRTRWRELFGPFSKKYLSNYSFRPYSKRYVTHLGDFYAQAHPDEDFAETFATWLTPGSRWEEKYTGWPALKKLRYVDHIMKEVATRPPTVTAYHTPYAAARMTSTLAAHYERRRKVLGEEFPGYYDGSLAKLFARGQDGERQKASRLLRSHRRSLINGVASWTGQRKYDISQLLIKISKRCDDLELYVGRAEPAMLIEITAFVTAVTNRVLRGVHTERHT